MAPGRAAVVDIRPGLAAVDRSQAVPAEADHSLLLLAAGPVPDRNRRPAAAGPGHSLPAVADLDHSLPVAAGPGHILLDRAAE